MPNTLELPPASQHLYITAAAHFRPVARNSSIFACQFVWHTASELINPGDLLIIKRENLTYTLWKLFLVLSILHVIYTIFKKCYHNLRYTITATSVQAVPIQRTSEISDFHSGVYISWYQKPSIK